MTLKQSQGHQTYNKNIDPKQGYNHAKSETSHFHTVQEKVNIKFFSTKICQVSLEHVLKSNIVTYS